jgi:hypothetical protein
VLISGEGKKESYKSLFFFSFFVRYAIFGEKPNFHLCRYVSHVSQVRHVAHVSRGGV